MFLDKYLQDNNIKTKTIRFGYLPLLMAFNKNSKSTPCRMVQCPNTQAVCKAELYETEPWKKEKNGQNSSPQQNHHMDNNTNELSTQKPKLLSYNDTIKDYDLLVILYCTLKQH